MKIRLLSDLHTEFRLPYKTAAFAEYRGEDVLVLAGDIASGSTNTVDVIKFFKKQGFTNIVYVPGNHEYYGTTIHDFDQKMHNKCAEIDGVHFLNPGQVVIGDVLFIGATLWTNFADNFFSMKAAQRCIADFSYIKGSSPEIARFRTDDAVQLYNKHVAYIKQAYEQRNGRKVVVVTHFLPATECISPRFANPADLVNDYFANNLGGYISEMTDTTWLFGHTHDHVDKVLGDTRVVANPHGYYNAMNDGIGFNPFEVVEV